MLRTTKKEAQFYTAFSDIIALTREAAAALNGLMNDYTDIRPKIERLTAYEHQCDSMVHDLFARVHAAFITPIDREDIYLLGRTLDDIMDEIEESAYLFYVYNTTQIKPEAIHFSELILNAVDHLIQLIALMPNMKAMKEMGVHITEVNRLENEGDALYREQLAKLFRDETDPIQVIRWNGIYSRLEKALDACEYVANVVGGVVLKHA
ncbi:MAG: DUF47 family protein [Oscillospiraceae bacterium]|nr:DUF47 family protein [Oscillospiraceae bacterium]